MNRKWWMLVAAALRKGKPPAFGGRKEPGQAGRNGPGPPPGDITADERVDITDPASALGLFYMGFSAPACMDDADAGTDGRLDLSGPIRGVESTADSPGSGPE